MEQTLSLGCLVMAAGSGRRFGGNKLAAELDGKTLIRRRARGGARRAVFRRDRGEPV